MKESRIQLDSTRAEKKWYFVEESRVEIRCACKKALLKLIMTAFTSEKGIDNFCNQ